MSLAESSRHLDPPHSPEIPNKPSVVFGTYFPKTILTNQEIESWRVSTPNGHILTADNIQKKTGVTRRYVANPTETPLSMGLNAAAQALNGKKADAVIVSTSFPTGINLSSRLQKEFGISGSNLDVHAACSGFTLSLAHIKQREQEFLGKKILLVSTEKYSPHLHSLRSAKVNTDPSLAQTIFSDGAIAMVFEYGRDLQIISALNHRFPKEVQSYIQMPVDKKLMIPPFIEEFVPYPESGKFEQDGVKVYRLICENAPQLIEKAIGKANLDSSQTIRMVIPHQGSGHMVDGISQRLNGYSVYNDFEEGNFSSASIPKALNAAIRKGEIKKGNIVVLAGFGAGIFASIVIVRLG